MLGKVAVVIAIGGLTVAIVMMVGMKYDSQMLNLAWILIAVKMADVMMALMYQSFNKYSQREQNNIKEDK